MSSKVIKVDLGALYKDCYLKKVMKSRYKEQDATIERMLEVISAVRDQGFDVEYQLGGLVGAMTHDHSMLMKGSELRIATAKVIKAIGHLGKGNRK